MKRILIFLVAAALIAGFFPIRPTAEAASSAAGGEYIVRLKEDPGASVSLFSDGGGGAGEGLVLAASEAELLALKAAGRVACYEPNYSVRLLGTVNDSYYSRQWNLRDVGVEAAWDAGLLGEGVTVAVIDSGINAQHEDFAGVNILQGLNMIDGSGRTDDQLGHGTFICGIIAAARNNRLGIAGIADGVNLLPIKCFSNEEEASVFDICLGIYAAVDDYGCDVICLSLGTTEDSVFLREAVDYAAAQDVIVVAAVGNEGTSELYYPAAYDSVIGTGAYDASGLYSSFSQENSSVFVSAPGSNIFSTYIGSASAYAQADGTSFSAPHIAALAAAARSGDPELTPDQFKALLMVSCADAGDPGYDVIYGYGKVDFTGFVAAFRDLQATGEENEFPFTDAVGHWAEDSIRACVASGLFNGVSDTRFNPDGVMTRAMFVTILYRWDNGALPAPAEAEAAFFDVKDADAWYYDAVYWAAANGITGGFDDGGFHPEDPITREQLMTLLYRYSGAPAEEDTGVLAVFNDYGQISPYAGSAMAWGYKLGLIGGIGNSTLSPAGNATRAQVAAIMVRYGA